MPTDNSSALARAKNRSVWIHETLRPVDTLECAKASLDLVKKRIEQEKANRVFMAKSRFMEWSHELSKADWGPIGNCLRDKLEPAAAELFEKVENGADYNSIIAARKYEFMNAEVMHTIGTHEGWKYSRNMSWSAYSTLSSSTLDTYVYALANASTYADFENRFWSLIYAVQNSVLELNAHKEREYTFCQGTPTSQFMKWACSRISDPSTTWSCANSEVRSEDDIRK